MRFEIEGLDPALFADLVGLDAERLAARGVRRYPVQQAHAAPCRITLDDAAPGETVLLLSHPHQTAASPYAQAGPIFVRETATAAARYVDEIPPAMARRVISLRGYDAAGMMLEGELCEGGELAGLIGRFWANADIAYAHAHYARRGCFAALVRRG